MSVLCNVEHLRQTTSHGNEVDAVRVTCTRCGHKAEAIGDTSAGLRQCFELLRAQCPRHETNFYTWEDEPNLTTSYRNRADETGISSTVISGEDA